MNPILHALADWMRHTVPEAQTRACVDTAPVMEKELAARAGVERVTFVGGGDIHDAVDDDGRDLEPGCV